MAEAGQQDLRSRNGWRRNQKERQPDPVLFPNWIRAHGPVVLAFLFLTIALTYPIILHPSTRIAGAFKGDNFQYLWQLWYPANALFAKNASLLFDEKVYFPFGFDLVRNQDLAPAVTLFTIPVTLLLGEVVTYNLLVLGSFFLTALGAYLLAVELWRNRVAGVLAGLSIGFCEYRISHAAGHLTLVTTQWIPFFFLYLERVLKNPSRRNGALCGLFYSLAALTTWYYAFLTLIGAALYVSLRKKWWRLGQIRDLLPAGVAMVLTAVVLVGPFALLYLMAGRRGHVEARPLQESQAFSASLADFLIPGVEHPVFGDWILAHWRKGANGLWLSEWQVYLGGGVIVLALTALFLQDPKRIQGLLIMGVGSIVVALGPSLYWTHPPAIPGADNLAPLSSLRMPVAFLAQVPPFTYLRAWARMGFFVQLSFGLLAAGGLATILDRIKATERRRLLSAGISVAAVTFIGFETLGVPFGTASVKPRPVDEWLASKPGDFAYMEYPIPNHGYSGPALYSRRLTGKRIVMGYGSYPPNLRFFGELGSFPQPNSLNLLKRWRVKYVLVDRSRYKEGVDFFGVSHTWDTLEPQLRASPMLRQETVRGEVYVYSLLP